MEKNSMTSLEEVHKKAMACAQKAYDETIDIEIEAGIKHMDKTGDWPVDPDYDGPDPVEEAIYAYLSALLKEGIALMSMRPK